VPDAHLCDTFSVCGADPLHEAARDVIADVEHFAQRAGRPRRRRAMTYRSTKTPISLAEINDAASKAVQLFSAMGLCDQGPVITGDATVVPQKTFTLDTTLRTTCPPSDAPESMH
jgi:hypothetical protein